MLQDWEWVDKTPVRVAEWYSPSNNIYSAVSEKLEYFQSQSYKEYRCTALVTETGNPFFPSNWLKIPCDLKFRDAGIICERKYINICGPRTDEATDKVVPVYNTDLPHVYHDLVANMSVLKPGSVGCKDEWTYFDGKCYKMLTSSHDINETFTCEEGQQLCKKYNSIMADFEVSDSRVFQSLMKIWNHRYEYGGAWVAKCRAVTDVQTERPMKKSPSFRLELNPRGNIDPPLLNVICELPSESKVHECGSHQFKCKDGTCILEHLQCDQKEDCLDGEDELDCEGCLEYDFPCNNSCLPPTMYCDEVNDCADGSDEKNCTFGCEDGKFQCRNGDCIYPAQVLDRVRDCIDGTDELPSWVSQFLSGSGDKSEKTYEIRQKMFSRGDYMSFYEDFNMKLAYRQEFYESQEVHRNNSPYCMDETKVRCRPDQVYCSYRQNGCILDQDIYGQTGGCLDGSHLAEENCKDMQCPNMFKCPDSYCIPYSKVCNKVSDCMDGMDEANCERFSCPGMFKCSKENYCIDQAYRCDGKGDCIDTREDERFCENFICPDVCECRKHMVNCTQRGFTKIPEVPSDTRSFLLNSNSLTLEEESPLKCRSLWKLELRGNKIVNIAKNFFKHLRNVLTLDLRNNKITKVTSYMFHGLNGLQHLLLEGNQITFIEDHAFSGLKGMIYLNLESLGIGHVFGSPFQGMENLKYLNFKDNSISSFDKHAFSGTSNLSILNVKGNRLIAQYPETYQDLELDQFYGEDFSFCCILKKVETCPVKPDAFSTCSDLLEETAFVALAWLFAGMAIIGNLGVIIWKLWKERHMTHSVLITNLAISDLIMGICLFVVASADQLFRGQYRNHHTQWRLGPLCELCAFFSTVSRQMSVFTLTIITTDVLMAVSKNIHWGKLNVRNILTLLVLGWFFWAIFASVPFMRFSYFGNRIVPDGVCLLLNFETGFYQGWEYISFTFLFVNIVLFTYMYFAFRRIDKLKNLSRRNEEKDEVVEDDFHISRADMKIAHHCSVLVWTDGICWLTICITSGVALYGIEMIPAVGAWMKMFILPLNSVLNPFLYVMMVVNPKALEFIRKKLNIKKDTPAVQEIPASKKEALTTSRMKAIL